MSIILCNAGQTEYDFTRPEGERVKCRACGVIFNNPSEFKQHTDNKANVRPKQVSPNIKRLDTLIGFLNADVAPDLGNIEKAAADFLRNNFVLVVGIADAFDERDNDPK